MYGGMQADYNRRVEAIVKETAGKITLARSENRDLAKLFHEILADLGAARRKIAIDHKTEDGERFGVRRDGIRLSDNSFGITSLFGQYEEYGKRLLHSIRRELEPIKRTLRTIDQTSLQVKKASLLGRASRVDFEILTCENHIWGGPSIISAARYVEFYELIGIEPPKSPPTKEDLMSVGFNTDAIRTLKEKKPGEYKKHKLLSAIRAIREMFPNKRMSDWVTGTVRFQVGDKMVALTQYVVWLYRTYKEDPIDRMSENSSVTLLHQDPFLIEMMLEEIAKVFDRVIRRDKQELPALQRDIALMEYEFAHAMPFARGSMAISEWIEMAIYESHGFEIKYKLPVNLEALTLPFQEFVEKYPSMVDVQKKSSQ